MRRLLFLLCFLSVTAKAQLSPGQHRMTGYVTSPGDGATPYLAVFTLSANGTISGYTITDWKSNSLRATLVGRMDKNGNIYLKEMPNPNDHSSASTFYCYFTALLRKAPHNGKVYYTGSYSSANEDGSPSSCSGGTMTISDAVPPTPLPSPKPKPVVTPKPKPKPVAPPPPLPRDTTPKPVIRDTLVAPVAPPPVLKPFPSRDTVPAPRFDVHDTVAKPVVVPKPVPPPTPIPPPAPKPDTPKKFSDTLSVYPLYYWETDSVVLEIWDGFKEDGDVVGIRFDGEQVIDKLPLLVNGKRRLAFALQDFHTHHLEILLYSEGNEPPNTPNIILTDGMKHFQVDISGKYGEIAHLWFRRKH